MYNVGIYYEQYGQQDWIILWTIKLPNCTQYFQHTCQYWLKNNSKHYPKWFSILLNIFGYCSYCTYCTSYNLLCVLLNIVQYMPELFNICQYCSVLPERNASCCCFNASCCFNACCFNAASTTDSDWLSYYTMNSQQPFIYWAPLLQHRLNEHLLHEPVPCPRDRRAVHLRLKLEDPLQQGHLSQRMGMCPPCCCSGMCPSCSSSVPAPVYALKITRNDIRLCLSVLGGLPGASAKLHANFMNQ